MGIFIFGFFYEYFRLLDNMDETMILNYLKEKVGTDKKIINIDKVAEELGLICFKYSRSK